jgi:acetolactate synthase-1/2/3 large subunit
VVHFVREADLVFGVGCSFTVTFYGVTIPKGKIMVHSTNDPADIDKDYRIDHAVIGDAKLVLQQLIEEVKAQAGPAGKKGESQVVGEVKAVKEEWLNRWMPKLTSDEIPINPYRVVWDLMYTVDRERTIINHDSGSPRDQMSPFFETLVPRGFIGWGKSTQLGYGLGLAIGAKLAAPDKLVVNVMGDAAFGQVGLDFETAVRERIPILVIVLNNSGMAIYGPDRFPVAQERYGAKNLSGNYAKVAEAMGGYNERVERPEEVAPAIRRAQQVVASGQPVLLEIMIATEYAMSDRLR